MHQARRRFKLFYVSREAIMSCYAYWWSIRRPKHATDKNFGPLIKGNVNKKALFANLDPIFLILILRNNSWKANSN